MAEPTEREKLAELIETVTEAEVAEQYRIVRHWDEATALAAADRVLSWMEREGYRKEPEDTGEQL